MFCHFTLAEKAEMEGVKVLGVLLVIALYVDAAPLELGECLYILHYIL